MLVRPPNWHSYSAKSSCLGKSSSTIGWTLCHFCHSASWQNIPKIIKIPHFCLFFAISATWQSGRSGRNFRQINTSLHRHCKEGFDGNAGASAMQGGCVSSSIPQHTFSCTLSVRKHYGERDWKRLPSSRSVRN